MKTPTFIRSCVSLIRVCLFLSFFGFAGAALASGECDLPAFLHSILNRDLKIDHGALFKVEPGSIADRHPVLNAELKRIHDLTLNLEEFEARFHEAYGHAPTFRDTQLYFVQHRELMTREMKKLQARLQIESPKTAQMTADSFERYERERIGNLNRIQFLGDENGFTDAVRSYHQAEVSSIAELSGLFSSARVDGFASRLVDIPGIQQALDAKVKSLIQTAKTNRGKLARLEKDYPQFTKAANLNWTKTNQIDRNLKRLKEWYLNKEIDLNLETGKLIEIKTGLKPISEKTLRRQYLPQILSVREALDFLGIRRDQALMTWGPIEPEAIRMLHELQIQLIKR
jgi:hypothetical protein